MKTGPSMQFVWPVAAEEAMASGAREIEPGHVLCAGLKFAEIDPQQLARALPDASLVEAIEAERRELVDALAARGVQVPVASTRLRRGLRKALRAPGPRQAREGERGLHRSDRTRAAFARAEKSLESRGAPLTAAALVVAVLEKPGEALAKALEALGVGQKAGKDVGTEGAPIAGAELGVDLVTREAAKRPNDDVLARVRRDAASKVVCDYLFGSGRSRPLLLVARDGRTADEVMLDVVRRLLWVDPPAEATRRCVFEIESTNVLGQRGEGTPGQRLERLFAEVKDRKSCAAWFEHFHRYLVPGPGGDELARAWRRFLAEAECGCVLGTTEDRFRERIEPDPIWKRLLRVVWIHDLVDGQAF